jgi:hypothetical protein
VNERAAQRWFKRCASGNLSLEDEQRPGRPQIWDSEATKVAAEQQPSTCMSRLSYTLGPSNSTIHRHRTALRKNLEELRIVPHEMTAKQAHRRVKFYRKLLQLPKGRRFIKRIITCDEKWIYLRSPSASGGTTKALFIMNLCHSAVRSTYILNN